MYGVRIAGLSSPHSCVCGTTVPYSRHKCKQCTLFLSVVTLSQRLSMLVEGRVCAVLQQYERSPIYSTSAVLYCPSNTTPPTKAIATPLFLLRPAFYWQPRRKITVSPPSSFPLTSYGDRERYSRRVIHCRLTPLGPHACSFPS